MSSWGFDLEGMDVVAKPRPGLGATFFLLLFGAMSKMGRNASVATPLPLRNRVARQLRIEFIPLLARFVAHAAKAGSRTL